MINGRISDKLEGCIKFLEFGRHGRALDFTENHEFDSPMNFTNSLERDYSQYGPQNNQLGKKTRRKLKPFGCNCEYVKSFV